jgi:hypothetical protein
MRAPILPMTRSRPVRTYIIPDRLASADVPGARGPGRFWRRRASLFGRSRPNACNAWGAEVPTIRRVPGPAHARLDLSRRAFL